MAMGAALIIVHMVNNSDFSLNYYNIISIVRSPPKPKL